jgi:hypothetical protein
MNDDANVPERGRNLSGNDPYRSGNIRLSESLTCQEGNHAPE